MSTKKSSDGLPHADQVEKLTGWGITPPPSMAAAYGIISYVETGFPFHGKLTPDERITFFKAAAEKWVGQKVLLEGEEATVSHVRGIQKSEGMTGRFGKTRHPLVGVMIRPEGSKHSGRTVQRPLAEAPFNEPEVPKT